MNTRPQRASVEEAIRDLNDRTLSSLPFRFSRLVYLASLRDYNTGRYYHDGLAERFGEEAAVEAMKQCHREEFQGMAACSVEGLVEHLEAHVTASRADSIQVLDSWDTLEAYRVTIPAGCDRIAKDLYFCNIKVALAILRARSAADRESPQSA